MGFGYDFGVIQSYSWPDDQNRIRKNFIKPTKKNISMFPRQRLIGEGPKMFLALIP